MHALHYSITVDRKARLAASRLLLTLVLAYAVYLLVLLVSIGVYPLADPSDTFTQGDCDQGLAWYRDPATMAYRLDCTSAHRER